MKNQVQLITYVDRLGCNTLTDLKNLFQNQLKGIFGGGHILPFYYPIDGEDAGFDPINHELIDPRLGDWNATYFVSPDQFIQTLIYYSVGILLLV